MAMTMRERIARAIEEGCDTSKVFGLFDYSQGRRVKPFVVRDYRLKENQVIFESDDMDLAREKYDESVAGYRADLVLTELETPTDGMLTAALVARYPDWGEAQCADSDDARVIDGMRLALAASAKAAREGK